MRLCDLKSGRLIEPPICLRLLVARVVLSRVSVGPIQIRIGIMNNETKSPRRILSLCIASSLSIVALAISTQLDGTARGIETNQVVASMTPTVAPMTRTAPLADSNGTEAPVDDSTTGKTPEDKRVDMSEHGHKRKPASQEPLETTRQANPQTKSMENGSFSSASVRVRSVKVEKSEVTPKANVAQPSIKGVLSSAKEEAGVVAAKVDAPQEVALLPTAVLPAQEPKTEGPSAEIPEVVAPPPVVAEPSTAIEHFEEKKGKNTFLVARTTIKASPEDVFEILTDYSKVDAIFDNLTRCEVVEDLGSAKRVAFTAKSLGGLWKFDYVLELKETAPFLIEWHRVSGAFKVNEGYWKLEPVQGGKYTQVTYSKFVDGGLLLPQKLVQKELKAVAPAVLKNLRTAAEKHSVAAK